VRARVRLPARVRLSAFRVAPAQAMPLDVCGIAATLIRWLMSCQKSAAVCLRTNGCNAVAALNRRRNSCRSVPNHQIACVICRRSCFERASDNHCACCTGDALPPLLTSLSGALLCAIRKLSRSFRCHTSTRPVRNAATSLRGKQALHR
jgi:hypothetical protein